MTVPVAPTGIKKLDEALGGGFPRNGMSLLVGPSGIGKTILALQWLAEGARNGESCVYVSTTIPSEAVIAYYGEMKLLKGVVDKIGWYDMYISPKDLIPFTTEKMLHLIHRVLPDYFDEQLNLIKPIDRLVLDSLTTVERMVDDPAMFRYLGATWIRFFHEKKIAMLFIEEMDGDLKVKYGEMKNFSEATVVMDYKEHENLHMRAMKILKRYGFNHPTYWIPFHIRDEGIVL
ncbi:RecA-superfamily ATPase possibly involved in signal transduction [Aciduliprofundum sp. MAR08-339]|uniref:RAD55 family ATPase n=1 Tax=Aciduliprofundum sp. (strain MAR08-339) TaxID=673860 RepID=UPI0002A4ABF9|nr:RecA-superfamily ATPase possibly involved in signal transduction [Aciduliprofundum sp. MAR08-339]